MITASPKIKSVLKNKLFLVGGIMILAFVLIRLGQTWNRGREIKSEIITLQEQTQSLEKENLELTELINYLNSVAYIEEKARVDLGLKKEGEKLVIVSSQNLKGGSAQAITAEGAETPAEAGSNIKKWWQHFFAGESEIK